MDGCERPGEVLEHGSNKIVEIGTKRSSLPTTAMIRHVEQPQMNGVAAYAKVFGWIVAGS